MFHILEEFVKSCAQVNSESLQFGACQISHTSLSFKRTPPPTVVLNDT